MAPSSAAKSGLVHRSTSSRSRSKIEKSCGSEQMMFYQDIFGRIPKYTPPSYTSVFADTMLQQTMSPSYSDEYLPRQKASSNTKKVSSSPVHAFEPHEILVNVTGTGNNDDNEKFGRSEGHGRMDTVSYDDVFGGISSISVSSSGPEILSDLLGNKGNHVKSPTLNITKDSYFSEEAPLNVVKPASPTFMGSFKDSAPFAKDSELHNSIKDSGRDITMAKNGHKTLKSSMREEAQEEGVDPSFFKSKRNHRNSKLKEHTYSTGIKQNHVRKDYPSHGEVRKHTMTKALRSPKIHKSSLKSEASIPSIEACQLLEDDMFWISISEVKLITEPSASLPPARPPPLPSSRIKMAPHESIGNATVSSASEDFVKDVLEAHVEGIKDVSTLMAEETVEGNTNVSASAMNVTKDSMDVTKEAIEDGSAMDAKEIADVTKGSMNDGFANDINEESVDLTKEGMKDGSKVEMEKLKDISVSMAEEKVKGSTSKATSTLDMTKETMDITNMCIVNASNDISASMAEEKVEESWSTLESSADITKESMNVTNESMEGASGAEIEKTKSIPASGADGKMEESTYMTTLTMDTAQERIDVTNKVVIDSSKSQINGIKDVSASMSEEKIEGSTSTPTSVMYITKESIDVLKAANNYTNEAAERDMPEVKDVQQDWLKPNDRRREDEESEGAAVPRSEHLEEKSNGIQNGALEGFQVVEEGRGEEKEEKRKNEIEEIETQKENRVIESYQKEVEGGGCQRFTTKEAILESNDRQPLKFKMEDRKTEEEVTDEDETKDGETDDVFLDCEYLADEDNAKESVVLGEPKVEQEARGNEKDEKHSKERQDEEMKQKEKEPPERHENERETQRYAAKESIKKTILTSESLDQQQYRTKLEDRKTGDVMISQGKYPGKEDKARENALMGALKPAKEGKGNKKGEESKIEIETEQSEKQEKETHPKEKESQQYGTKESIQKNVSGLKDMQDDRLKPNRVRNEEKEKKLGKEHRAREGNTMGSFQAEQEGRGQELGEKQGKGREETVRIEKEKEARERREKEKEERERQREREKDRITIEMFTREAHERARERERAGADTWEKAAADFRERKAKSFDRANSFSKESETAPSKERANTNALLQERLNVADAREKARAALYRANAEMLERSVVERAASEARARALRAAVARVKSDVRDRATSPSNIQSNKSSPSGSFRKVVSTMPTRSGPLFYDATSFNVSSASVEFQETEGEPAERRKARWERHQRTVERAAKALEEKNERDRQAQREQAERHRIAQIVDTDIKRWVTGKEGNLRALLSTLQYILWREAGWQPIPLTDLLAAASVKKAYRKATLCVHPDKVQQKGATVQQKYIAEKVFDLLKEAWNKFSSDEML